MPCFCAVVNACDGWASRSSDERAALAKAFFTFGNFEVGALQCISCIEVEGLEEVEIAQTCRWGGEMGCSLRTQHGVSPYVGARHSLLSPLWSRGWHVALG